MSTIGTTLKQPRVFAHDAIALDDLCGNISGTIVTPGLLVPLVAPDVGGTGYAVGGPHATVTNGGGSGATVTINNVAAGAVTDFDITGIGQDYEVGDSLTVQSGNNDCIIFITETGCSAWALGDPITPMPNEALGSMNSVPYWNEKTAYVYSSAVLGTGPFETPGPGAALYVGAAMDITVINESTTEVTYKGVAAGSFLPVSVLSVTAQSAGGLDDILALF
jgi:hypothetical protein|tara:strand:+ start:1587 stop:2249 length:663 start_codon:yes stop_codon:yes gene_type:complete